MSKNRDQPLIDCLRALLSQGSAGTQEALREGLLKKGFDVNQSKISRLLRKLAAIKTMGLNGEVVYQLPMASELPVKGSSIEDLVLDIVYNEIVIVLRTSPGSASLIARVIDHHTEKLSCIGTVAGDDTIFVVPKSIKTIETTIQLIKNFLFK